MYQVTTNCYTDGRDVSTNCLQEDHSEKTNVAIFCYVRDDISICRGECREVTLSKLYKVVDKKLLPPVHGGKFLDIGLVMVSRRCFKNF